MRSDKRGFTLVELIMVIVILGILAVIAIPKMLDLSQEAQESAVDGVVGAVRAGIMIYHANELVNGRDLWPDDLEVDPNDSGLFEKVLEQGGVASDEWSNPNPDEYQATIGSSTRTYIYDPDLGSFTLQ